MENEFVKLNFTETSVMLALSKYNLHPTLHSFVHDTLIGMKEVPRYLIHDRLVYVVVVSNGRAPFESIRDLEEEGVVVIDVAKQIIDNRDFVTTNNIVSVIAIVPGNMFMDRNRLTRAVRSKGREKHLRNCAEEDALNLRAKLYNEDLVEMGFSKIVVMHKVIKDASKKKRLLNVSINDNRECITARIDVQNNTWSSDTGFAFELLRVFPRK